MVMISVVNGFPKPNVHYLSNGAIAITVDDPSSKISSLYVFVRTGSVFEDEVIGSGASHYLEHLLAGGTTSLKEEKEYRKIIDELGGAYNAYTSYDHTAYYIHTSSNNALRALQTLYEWTVHGDWTATEFQRENGVIKKEMERAKSNIDRQIYQNAQQLFYQTSPYAYPILGHEEIFDKLTDSDLKRYYKTRYVPENMVIVVGGDISRNVIVNYIEETFGKEPYLPRKPQYKGGGQRILSKSKVTIVLPELKTKRLMLRYPTVSFYDNDVYPLDLLAYILGNGQQSVLYQEFVVRRKLATKVSVRSITPSNEYGYFEIFLETTQPSEDVINAVQEFIETLKVMGFNNQQINAAKKQKKNEYILSNTSMDYYLREIGQSMMMGNNPLFFSIYANNFSNVSNLMLKESMKTYLIHSKCQEYEFLSQYPTEDNSLNVDKKDIVMDQYKSGVDIIYIPDNNTEIVSVIVHLEGGLINETKRTKIGRAS